MSSATAVATAFKIWVNMHGKGRFKNISSLAEGLRDSVVLTHLTSTILGHDIFNGTPEDSVPHTNPTTPDEIEANLAVIIKLVSAGPCGPVLAKVTPPAIRSGDSTAITGLLWHLARTHDSLTFLANELNASAGAVKAPAPTGRKSKHGAVPATAVTKERHVHALLALARHAMHDGLKATGSAGHWAATHTTKHIETMGAEWADGVLMCLVVAGLGATVDMEKCHHASADARWEMAVNAVRDKWALPAFCDHGHVPHEEVIPLYAACVMHAAADHRIETAAAAMARDAQRLEDVFAGAVADMRAAEAAQIATDESIVALKNQWNAAVAKGAELPSIRTVMAYAESVGLRPPMKKGAVPPPPLDKSVGVVFIASSLSSQFFALEPLVCSAALALFRSCLDTVLQLFAGYISHHDASAALVLFPTPLAGMKACIAIQAALLELPWPPSLLLPGEAGEEERSPSGVLLFRGLRVGMGVHAGSPTVSLCPLTARSHYYGPDVDIAVRLGAIAAGGQITLSEAGYEALLETDAGSQFVGQHVITRVETEGVWGSFMCHVCSPALADRRFAPRKSPAGPKPSAASGLAGAVAELRTLVRTFSPQIDALIEATLKQRKQTRAAAAKLTTLLEGDGGEESLAVARARMKTLARRTAMVEEQLLKDLPAVRTLERKLNEVSNVLTELRGVGAPSRSELASHASAVAAQMRALEDENVTLRKDLDNTRMRAKTVTAQAARTVSLTASLAGSNNVLLASSLHRSPHAPLLDFVQAPGGPMWRNSDSIDDIHAAATGNNNGHMTSPTTARDSSRASMNGYGGRSPSPRRAASVPLHVSEPPGGVHGGWDPRAHDVPRETGRSSGGGSSRYDGGSARGEARNSARKQSSLTTETLSTRRRAVKLRPLGSPTAAGRGSPPRSSSQASVGSGSARVRFADRDARAGGGGGGGGGGSETKRSSPGRRDVDSLDGLSEGGDDDFVGSFQRRNAEGTDVLGMFGLGNHPLDASAQWAREDALLSYAFEPPLPPEPIPQPPPAAPPNAKHHHSPTAGAKHTPAPAPGAAKHAPAPKKSPAPAAAKGKSSQKK